MKQSDNGPRIRPVDKIELSEKNVKLRTAVIILAIIIGAGALAYGLGTLLNSEPGWMEIEVSTSELTYGESFKLQYYFGDSGAAATVERRQLTTLYTDAMEKAYILFNENAQSDVYKNLYYINRHPNEEIEVDALLYAALEKLEQYNSRYIYLASVNTEYDRLFNSETEAQAELFDPSRNGELADYLGQLAAFANDPESVDIALIGENKIRLAVSEEYLDFAEEYDIKSYISFSWLKNAFIADYVAELMSDSGYTRGSISSYDGFTRNLDASGMSYSLNIYDRVGNTVYLPARMDYTEPMSIVSLRNYPMSDRDKWSCYVFSDGRSVTTLIDPADGMSKSAVNNMISYSSKLCCADVVLQIAPLYISDSLETDALQGLKQNGIFSVWGSDSTIFYDDPELALTLNSDVEIPYSSQLVN